MKEYEKYYKNDYGLSAAIQVLDVYPTEKQMKYDLEKLMLEVEIPIYQSKTNQWILIHETQDSLIKEKFYNNDH